MTGTEEFFENRLLRGLTKSQITELLEAGKVETLPGDSQVMNEGETVDDLFIVLSGAVKVYLPENERRVARVNLSTLGSGECFGEYAFIDGHPASASVRTHGTTSLYRIPYRRMRDAVASDPQIGSVVFRNLLGVLVKRLRASNAELDLFTISDDYTASV
jgi:serine/threonine-protein kinase